MQRKGSVLSSAHARPTCGNYFRNSLDLIQTKVVGAFSAHRFWHGFGIAVYEAPESMTLVGSRRYAVAVTHSVTVWSVVALKGRIQ